MTEIKALDGMISDGKERERRKIVVRFTSDNWGESISLEAEGRMLHVPFEPVQKMIDAARKKTLTKTRRRKPLRHSYRRKGLIRFDSGTAAKPTIIYKKENGARYEHSALAILINITTENKRWESSRELSTEQEEPCS